MVFFIETMTKNKITKTLVNTKIMTYVNKLLSVFAKNQQTKNMTFHMGQTDSFIYIKMEC